ncbi:MAG: L-fucose/L-arabinose isomerase family protein [Opitutaceae bacterium]|jgi:L-arabinose isomerase|nr:L-fucose/L-arabinose isomerase family protein [Opitutaceae bacterium]
MSTTNTTPAPLSSAPAPRIARLRPLTARAGLVGIGHHVYWPQFPGLLDEMIRKQNHVRRRIEAHGVTVSDFGMLDTAQAACEVVPRVKAADIDLLFVDMVTYGTSSTFGILCREINVPIVLVAIQPLAAMDYPNGTTFMQLCNDDFCSVPEFTGVAIRFGRKPPPVILGHEKDDPVVEAELKSWCGIAKVLHSLRKARLGLMGHVLESMLDMHTDPTAITAAFGPHVVLVEPGDIHKHYRAPDAAAVEKWKEKILGFFDTPDPKSDPLTEKLTTADLDTAARAAVALEGLIADKKLDGLAYYYEAEPGSELRTLVTNLIVGNSLLTGAGFPMCGEFDIKTCVAMMIMDRLDIGGSFAEFHPVDFAMDSVLVGHDGPHHINIAASKPVIRSLKKYHGKPGSGAGVEFRIKEGPVTMLSIGQKADGKFKFVIAEGESARRPIPPTGNTNTHGIFKPDVRTFLKRWVAEGPTHHFALGIGHHAAELVEIAKILDLDYAVVTPFEDRL